MMTSVIKKTKEHRSCSSIPGVNAHSNSLRRVKKKRIFHSAEWTFQKKISQIGTITPRPGDHLILCVPMAKADFKKKNNPQQHTGLLLFWHFQVALKKKILGQSRHRTFHPRLALFVSHPKKEPFMRWFYSVLLFLVG